MKYLCLVYFEEKNMQSMSQAEWDALNQECLACGDNLRSGGHWLGGEALQSVDTATTIRVRNGKATTTDGPFAETKEQLAGFYLLDARDLNEAIQLASKIPPARYGSIEVRPIREVVTEGNQSLAAS
jgi:hypothetical protein